jgi:hypothetical protein
MKTATKEKTAVKTTFKRFLSEIFPSNDCTQRYGCTQKSLAEWIN